MGANFSGVITDFPKTSARYTRNRCLNLGKNTPFYMSPVQPGGLMQVITPEYLPPAEAPKPVLTESDVAKSPLPLIAVRPPSSNPGGAGTTDAASGPPNGKHRVAASFLLSKMAMLLFTILLLL